MPVILDPDDYEAWLTANDPQALQKLLQPFPAQLMMAYPISTKVNSVKNDTPDVIEPLAAGTQLSASLF
jgi:putative SOS response-associated peptidase YedK